MALEPVEREVLHVRVDVHVGERAVVEAVRPQVAGARFHLRLGEEIEEPGAAPDDVADAASRRGRRKRVARALVERLHLDLGEAAEVGERQPARPPHQAGDLELPGGGVDPRDAEVREHVEALGRRDPVEQLVRRQRHAADGLRRLEHHVRRRLAHRSPA
jgi:hypothetical protein